MYELDTEMNEAIDDASCDKFECCLCTTRFKTSNLQAMHETKKHFHNQNDQCFGCHKTNFKTTYALYRHQRTCKLFKTLAADIKQRQLLQPSQALIDILDSQGELKADQPSTTEQTSKASSQPDTQLVNQENQTTQPLPIQQVINNYNTYNNYNNCNNTDNSKHIVNSKNTQNVGSGNNNINLNLRPVKLTEIQKAIIDHIAQCAETKNYLDSGTIGRMIAFNFKECFSCSDMSRQHLYWCDGDAENQDVIKDVKGQQLDMKICSDVQPIIQQLEEMRAQIKKTYDFDRDYKRSEALNYLLGHVKFYNEYLQTGQRLLRPFIGSHVSKETMMMGSTKRSTKRKADEALTTNEPANTNKTVDTSQVAAQQQIQPQKQESQSYSFKYMMKAMVKHIMLEPRTVFGQSALDIGRFIRSYLNHYYMSTGVEIDQDCIVLCDDSKQYKRVKLTNFLGVVKNSLMCLEFGFELMMRDEPIAPPIYYAQEFLNWLDLDDYEEERIVLFEEYEQLMIDGIKLS